MNSYVDNIKLELTKIKEKLSTFLASIEIEWHSYPSNVVAPPYSYNKKVLSSDKKSEQITIKREYFEWKNHFDLLIKNISDHDKRIIEKTYNNIEHHIELKNGWLTKRTGTENINDINKYFEELYSVLKIFKTTSTSKALIIDTNSLIICPDFVKYKKLLTDNHFTIVLLPTVLSELDTLKIVARSNDLREKIKSVITRIKGLRVQGSLHKGVTVHKTITIKMIAKDPDFKATLNWLDKDIKDDKIVASTLELQREDPSVIYSIVTHDINLQNKAEIAKIPFMEPPKNR